MDRTTDKAIHSQAISRASFNHPETAETSYPRRVRKHPGAYKEGPTYLNSDNCSFCFVARYTKNEKNKTRKEVDDEIGGNTSSPSDSEP